MEKTNIEIKLSWFLLEGEERGENKVLIDDFKLNDNPRYS